MNKFVMFIWGLTIFCLCAVIFLIGYKKQDKDYNEIKANIKSASVVYMKEKNIYPSINESVKIFVEDLINGEYLQEDERIEKYCIDSVVFHNGIITDTFKIKKECKSKE